MSMKNTKKQLVEMVEELKKNNQMFLQTTLSVLYEDLPDADLRDYSELANAYTHLRYATPVSDIKQEFTSILKFYAEKASECEGANLRMNDIEEELGCEALSDDDPLDVIKKLKKENEEIKEQSVPKDILFADRAGHAEQIKKLKKTNYELNVHLNRCYSRLIRIEKAQKENEDSDDEDT